MALVRRSKKPSAPKASKAPRTEWEEERFYPGLSAEAIRGVRVFRHTGEPSFYRIVNQRFTSRHLIAWPAVVAIKNERNIRFRNAMITFGLIKPGDERVTEWRDASDFPAFANRHVFEDDIPEYVLMTLDWEISDRVPR